MNVIAIEEAQDISLIKMEELIGLLITFEMAMNEKKRKKKERELLSRLM